MHANARCYTTDHKGASLFELLIALFILSQGVIGMVAGAITSLHYTRHGLYSAIAIEQAQRLSHYLSV